MRRPFFSGGRLGRPQALGTYTQWCAGVRWGFRFQVLRLATVPSNGLATLSSGPTAPLSVLGICRRRLDIENHHR